MRPRLLEIICCPICETSLVCAQAKSDENADEIVEGELCCDNNHRFPIRSGVPRLLPPDLTTGAEGGLDTGKVPSFHGDGPSDRNTILKKTMRSFGYQWNVFSEMYPHWESNTRSYFEPLVQDADFRDRLVLDAGCGFGRHAYYVAKRGGEVVAMDISEAVGAAYRNLQRFDKVHVIQADIYNPPLKPLFHMVYCIGVIQHLPEPGRGFRALSRLMRPGGRFFVWVYGKRVGIYRSIDLMRKISTRLPMRVLYPLTFVLNIASHVCFSWPYKILRSLPGCNKLAGRWPFTRYADLPLRAGQADWFDRLSVPSTVYFSKENVANWYDEAKLVGAEIVSRDGIGWCALGTNDLAESTTRDTQVG